MRHAIVTLLFLLPASAVAQVRHILDKRQCDVGLSDSSPATLAAHLCSTHRICPPGPGAAGVAFGPLVFASREDCVRVQTGAVDACHALRDSGCSSIPECTSVDGRAAGSTTPAVDRAIAQMITSGKVDSSLLPFAGFEIGVSINQSIARSQARHAEKLRLEEAARLEAERVAAAAAAEKLERAWKTLNEKMHLTAAAPLEMRLEDAKQGISFRFDGADPNAARLTTAELASRAKNDCAFSGVFYEQPLEQWTPPYERAQVIRAVSLVRATIYAKPEEREPLVDQALAVGRGCRPPSSVPEDDKPVPDNAVDLLQLAGTSFKIAVEDRKTADAELADLDARLDTLKAAADATRLDASADPAARKAFLDGLERSKKDLETRRKDAARRRAAAMAAADSARTRERQTLVAVSLRAPSVGGLVADCAAEEAVIATWKKMLLGIDKQIADVDSLRAGLRADSRESINAAKVAARDGAVQKAVSEFTDALSKFQDAVVEAQRHARIRGAPESVRHSIAELTRKFQEKLGEVEELQSDLEKARASAEAGYAFGKKLATTTQSAVEIAMDLAAAVDEAGLLSDLGELTTGLKAAPAFAARWFPLVDLGIRVYVDTHLAVANDWRAEALAADLERLRDRRRFYADRLAEREAFLRDVKARNACFSPPK